MIGFTFDSNIFVIKYMLCMTRTLIYRRKTF